MCAQTENNRKIEKNSNELADFSGRFDNLGENLLKLSSNEHICAIYRKDEDKIDSIMEFLKTSIVKNERCVIIVDKKSKEDILTKIKSLDEIRNLLDTSAIVLVDSEDIYGKKSDFNLARTIESIESFLEIPQEDNFNGLRIIIEILPVTNENTTINTMMEFHSNIDKLISNRNIYFFYLYNEYKFESNTLLDVILIHSRLIFNGYLCKNPLFMNPHQLQLMREDRLDEKLYKKAIYKIVQREIIEQKRVKIDSYIQAEVRNSVNDSIFSLDYKGNILEVNEAIYKTRGYTEEEIIEPVCHGEVRILLVEDDEDVREITKIMLENHGYIVITAENGENALDLYNDSFDLVLTDIIMPIMGGEKLIEMLLEINPQVKCLAMTGYSNVNVPEGVKVLNKPMTTSKLVNYVKNELEQETCQEKKVQNEKREDSG